MITQSLRLKWPGNLVSVFSRQASIFTITVSVFITLCWGNSLWITCKAHVAQYLIAESWQQSLTTGTTVKPWSWADTWPVAKLEFPMLNQSLYVLAGSDGTSLAFGPGHMDGTALPDEPGTMIINGHRDTHFQLLEKIQIGDRLKLQSSSGVWQRFEVTDTQILDTSAADWFINRDANQLLLITCYPFNSLDVDPPLRYVVIAAPV